MASLKYSVHAYAWTTSWSDKTLGLIDRARRLGFDALEIPLMEIERVNPARIRDRAQKAGMGLCTSTACSLRNDPTGEDEATRKRAAAYLKTCVKATADMGATVFTGVTYSAIGRRLAGRPGREYWRRAAQALKETARYAQEFGVTVGIEPINRYESFLVNTCDQALMLRERIDEPNVRVHLDAYHMNIEEKGFFEPTLKAAPCLCHYHLSESHRGTPGTGTVDWDGIYRALAEAGYAGTVGLESFCETSDAMRAATCIWRTLAPSSDLLLAEGLQYLKALERKHYGAAAGKGGEGLPFPVLKHLRKSGRGGK
jgi:D-psicose/D-tagatose/L-ribulose 3-epimerase